MTNYLNFIHGKITFKVRFLFFLMPLFTLFGSCQYYKIERTLNDGSRVESGLKQDKYIILHFENFAWHLLYPKLNKSKNVLTGKLGELGEKHLYYKRANTRKTKGIRYKIEEGYPSEELHLYVNELVIDSLENVELPLDAVTRIDVYSDDKRARTLSVAYGTLLIGGGAFVVTLMTLFVFVLIY
ncbi:MAG: hypothetical protein SGJ00_08225 [bacterium]|nr:hypothetical protein [bacterium]